MPGRSRRDRRGIKWYDGIQLLLAAPWHVVAGLGGTLLLFLWSLGIAAAVALLCFAGSLSVLVSLAVIGGAFAIGLWWGPGSERVRSPIHRALDPLARRGVPWLLGTLLLAALGSGRDDGTDLNSSRPKPPRPARAQPPSRG